MSSPEQSRPVAVSTFSEHVKKYSQDDNALFGQEFDLLKKVCKHHPTSVAMNPINIRKVRHVNLPPFDYSRVKLQPTEGEGSDFISANYMTGYRSPKEYIATQGPLRSTRSDFWRMIWEQNIQVIVMLTRCFHKAVEKCNQYWPEDVQVPCKYGDILVEVTKRTVEEEWNVSELILKGGDEQRNVIHVQFTAWSDFGTPSKPQSLLKFMKLVHDNFNRGGAPLVVHCSAGVGRTGTFLTLDITKQQLENENCIDVFGTVCQLRNCRMEMIETLDQYIFVHKCLDELIKEHKS